MKFDDVKSIANAKVWTGEQALSMKLIDNVGDFEAVVKDTAKSVGSLGRADPGASGERPQDAAGFIDGRRFAVSAGRDQDDESQHVGFIICGSEKDRCLGLGC